MYVKYSQRYLLASILAIVFFLGCSKGSDEPSNPCAGVTITVSGTAGSTSAPGVADGSITATASGASGLTFSLNGGTAQASGSFSNLAAGAYTITAKTAQGCSGTASFTVTSGDACAGKTITVGAKVTNSDKCSPSGTIKVEVTGSTGFTYRLNADGTYQNEDLFNNVAPGTYTVYAKDGAGCEKTTTATVGELANGPLFTAVKTLINSKCTSCHVAGHISGIDFTVECNIVSRKTGIKTQAVDNETMPKGGPALTATEKKVITDWIDAGGKATN